MDTYKNISNELKLYFKRNKYFENSFPFSTAITFGAAALMLACQFLGIGGLIYSIVYYSFLMGLLFSYANYKQKTLYMGFFIFGCMELLRTITGVVKGGYLNYSAFFSFIFFVWIGFSILKYDSKSRKLK